MARRILRGSGMMVALRTGLILLLAWFLMACAATQPAPDASGAAMEDAAVFAEAQPAEVAPAPASPPPPAAEPDLQPDAPMRYVVQEGDTLWDIANTFLQDPWRWPEIWRENPQVRNPDRIYPGDVLSIHMINGRQQIMVDGGPRIRPTQRLSPQIREEVLIADDYPIATLQTFMFRPQVVTQAMLDEAPYIVAAQDDRSLFGTGDQVYVRHAETAQRFDLYHLVRRDRELLDPDSGESLGIATLPIGEAEIVQPGPVATVALRNTEREARVGDRLIGFDQESDLLFDITAAPAEVSGHVILLFDAISQTGRLQSVVVSRGARDGLRNGQVLVVKETGRRVKDTISGDDVDLPDEAVGLVMVFRTFDKVAYALIMESTRSIREGFRVEAPQAGFRLPRP